MSAAVTVTAALGVFGCAFSDGDGVRDRALRCCIMAAMPGDGVRERFPAPLSLRLGDDAPLLLPLEADAAETGGEGDLDRECFERG